MRVTIYTKSRPQPIEVELEDEPGLVLYSSSASTGSRAIMSIGKRKGTPHSVYVAQDDVIAIVPG